jgi:hypothetical protein
MGQISQISEHFRNPEYPALLEAGISAPAGAWNFHPTGIFAPNLDRNFWPGDSERSFDGHER